MATKRFPREIDEFIELCELKNIKDAKLNL
jgi:hypothetical protein